ncbi:CCA tRNA nucleotidyltransferase 1, mitochondrial-like [Planococcus citri]|uniref:CCA tRNA nucleotidyltransferase 1, mitochondrial-like n=1 Tax=Planococcus citri TaxID=170843 RepID=UPI0031F73D4D
MIGKLIAKQSSICLTYARYAINEATCVKFIKFSRFQRGFSSLNSSSKVPFTMKIDTPEFQSLFTPELNTLAELFSKYGYEIRIVGGAVRDLLNGKKPHDLDFATTATPQQMKEMFEKEQIRMLNNKGEKHGTITPRINDKENFEVTTLRNDVKTDGRHAEVEFTTDWQVDAARRDLTINSMFLGLDGTVYDYFGGYEDLKNKRVLFVGTASKRIQEDYLRILRYFRFFGRIVENANSHDEKTLEAIRENGPGLQKISGERIWSELNRIIVGNFCEEIVKKMFELGLSPYMGLGSCEELEITTFEKICRLREKYAFKAITSIAALLPDEEKVEEFHCRVKLSSHERNLALFLVVHKTVDFNESKDNPLRPFQRLLIMTTMKKDQVREYIMELFRFHDREDLIESFKSWKMPYLPIKGENLKEKGVKGVQMGVVINRMKELWIDSDFQLTETDLMGKLPEILTQLPGIMGEQHQRKNKKIKTSS